MSEEQMPKNYRLLKGIVITLGILIVVMLIILVVASINKYNDQKRAEAALVEKYQSSRPVSSPINTPFEIDLPLEPGQQILSAESGANGILIRIGTDMTQQIILVDYSGKIIGTINVK